MFFSSSMGLYTGAVNSDLLYDGPETVFVSNIVYDSGSTVRFQKTVASANGTFFVFGFPLLFVVTSMGVRYSIFESVRFFL